jgi:hypothetical protein
MKKYLNKYYPLIISIVLIFYFRKSIFFSEDYYYYIFNLVLIFFLISYSIIHIFLKKNVRVFISIIFLSFIISFYFYEYYQKMNNDKNLKNILNNLNNENNSIKKTFDNLKKHSSTYAFWIPKIINNDKFLILSGKSLSKTIHCNEGGFFSIYDSDRYGFNNPDQYWDVKEIDYLFIGDSFTHGACVNRPNDISSVVKLITNKKVLNLGITANGPLRNLAILKEYSPEKVKNIIWIHTDNDVLDLINEKKNSVLLNYLNIKDFKQNLKNNQKEINHFLGDGDLEGGYSKVKIYSIVDFFKLYYFRNNFYQIYQNYIISNIIKTEDQLYFKIIEEASLFAKERGANFYLVYLPSSASISYDKSLLKYFFKEMKSYILVSETAKKQNLNFIDLNKQLLRKESDPSKLFYGLISHYNELGYKKISEYIVKALRKENR